MFVLKELLDFFMIFKIASNLPAITKVYLQQFDQEFCTHSWSCWLLWQEPKHAFSTWPESYLSSLKRIKSINCQPLLDGIWDSSWSTKRIGSLADHFHSSNDQYKMIIYKWNRSRFTKSPRLLNPHSFATSKTLRAISVRSVPQNISIIHWLNQDAWIFSPSSVPI